MIDTFTKDMLSYQRLGNLDKQVNEKMINFVWLILLHCQVYNSPIEFDNQMSTSQGIQLVGEQKKQKKIGNYLIQKTLGKGTFGKVKLATHLPTGQKVAIKILEKDKIVDVADVERVSREIHILKLIRHPNIIQLYEIIETPKHLFLVMEYMEKGELFDHIVSKRRLDEEEACKILEQMISGIEYIHKLRIVHRDLKLENCLIDYDNTIRVVDFGLSNTYKPDERLRTACGSPCYAAPQMIEGKNYQPIMVDIWSAGVILFAMVCGYLPFEDKDTPKLYKKILKGQYTASNHISHELQDFIEKILTVDPLKRIRIDEMKKHPWWRKYSDNYYPEGLIVGYHKIPIESRVLKEIENLDMDPQLTQKSLQTNLHNSLTTTYYIILKKLMREGRIQKRNYDDLDRFAIESQGRRSKNNLKPADLLKMITTPVAKSRTKSYFIPHPGSKQTQQDSRHPGFNSVRIDQKRKSSSKLRNKSKSGEKHQSYNTSKFFKTSKSQTRDKSANKSMHNKSSSNARKSPKKGQKIRDEEYQHMRMRADSQKNKMGKKSHQGSLMIGAQVGADWPLQPKWKPQQTSKPCGPLRRR